MPGVRAAAAAVAFLTRVPVGRVVELDAADVARGTALFPLVGAGIGAAVGALADALAAPLSPPLAAVLAVGVGAALTGALHLDGLADAADALGAPTRERALEVMRDHRIGVYGALALLFDVGLRVTAVAVLAAHGDALRYCACAACVARIVPVVLGVALPYARTSGKAGFAAAAGPLGTAIAVATALAAAVLLRAWPLGLVPVAAVALLAPVLLRWLGGVTGDVLGASAEVTEAAALVLAVALT
jgi:adenosylcobinamide-GDP ribazoletransferase